MRELPEKPVLEMNGLYIHLAHELSETLGQAIMDVNIRSGYYDAKGKIMRYTFNMPKLVSKLTHSDHAFNQRDNPTLFQETLESSIGWFN